MEYPSSLEYLLLVYVVTFVVIYAQDNNRVALVIGNPATRLFYLLKITLWIFLNCIINFFIYFI